MGSVVSDRPGAGSGRERPGPPQGSNAQGSNAQGSNGKEGPQGRARRSARNPGSIAYQGAFEAVFAILISAGIGYWADGHFGTAPRYLLVGFAVGFGAFVLRLWRLGQALNPPGPEEDERH